MNDSLTDINATTFTLPKEFYLYLGWKAVIREELRDLKLTILTLDALTEQNK